jgi:hypothetical protein
MAFHSCSGQCRWLAALLLLAIAGCGGGSEQLEVVPVSGVVMYKGNPVSGAQVSFVAEGSPRPATGVTNDKGEFQLSTYDVNDGAVPGEHTITVAKFQSQAAAAAPAMDSREMLSRPGSMLDGYRQTVGDPRTAKGPQSELPEKYSKPESSGLKETVKKDGENRFVLQLTD